MRGQDVIFDLAETRGAGAHGRCASLVGSDIDRGAGGHRREVQRVARRLAQFATGDGVAASVVGQDEHVIPVTAQQRIVSRPAGQGIVAGATQKRIGPGPAGERIVAGAAIDIHRSGHRRTVEGVGQTGQGKGLDLGEGD